MRFREEKININYLRFGLIEDDFLFSGLQLDMLLFLLGYFALKSSFVMFIPWFRLVFVFI